GLPGRGPVHTPRGAQLVPPRGDPDQPGRGPRGGLFDPLAAPARDRGGGRGRVVVGLEVVADGGGEAGEVVGLVEGALLGAFDAADLDAGQEGAGGDEGGRPPRVAHADLREELMGQRRVRTSCARPRATSAAVYWPAAVK